MNKHITQDDMIKYLFELLEDDTRSANIASHLDSCAQCRRALYQLKAKFSALDILKHSTQLSDNFIADTLKNAAVHPGRPNFVFPEFVRKLSVAAVLLIAAAIAFTFMNHSQQPQKPKPVKTDISNDTYTTNGDAPMAKITPDKDITKQPAVSTRIITPAPSSAQRAIPDKPPFAPASAIELNVLPRRDNVQLTIYNSADLTLVRETRELTVKKGWNWLQFTWTNTLIDPTSLNIEPTRNADKIDVQQLVFPPRLKDLGRWLIRSEIEAKVPFQITYFTSGLSWRAFYMGTLNKDQTKLAIDAYVRVNNRSGETYENAQTRMIVGQVHILDQIDELAQRQFPFGSPVITTRNLSDKFGVSTLKSDVADQELLLYGGSSGEGIVKRSVMAGMPLKPKQIQKKGLSEYFLYTIEGTETIPDKWAKRLLSFSAADIDVNSLYKYDQQRWADQTRRFISFKNDEKHNLGNTPIPNGSVKIYALADQTKANLSFVASTDIKYIPVNEEVELPMGLARLVKVEPVLMETKTDNYLYDRKGNIAGCDQIQTWHLNITNARTLPVELEITRALPHQFWILTFSVIQNPQNSDVDIADAPVSHTQYEKYDITHARFKTKIPPNSKRIIKYTVTIHQGKRQNAFKK